MAAFRERWQRWWRGGSAGEPGLDALLLEHYPGAVMLLDDQGVVRRVNPTFERHAGHPPEQLLGRRAVTLDIDPLHGDFARALEQCVATRRPWQGLLLCRRADGSLRHQTTMIQPLRRDDGPLRLLVMQYDVTGMRERELRDRQLLGRLESTVSRVPGALFRLRQGSDGHLEFLFLGEALRSLFGLAPEQCMDDPEALLGRLPGDDRQRFETSLAQSTVSLAPWQLEFRLSLAEGMRWVEARATPLARGQGDLMWDGLLIDIDERKQVEQRVQRLVGTDMLTGALNRRAFLEQGEAALARAFRHGQTLSLAMLDLDHFKALNDTYGHAVGDLALQAFATTCRESLRPYDLFARIGGEEFVVVLVDSRPEEAWSVLERLRQAVAAIELESEAEVVRFTVSLGLAVLVGEGSLESGLAQADRALYRAKRSGRNRICGPEVLIQDPGVS
ncbi:diguanylate cyclase [Halomonas sp. SSL-5]|uniref:sensor domain-containing diguanylate cyclase n=1 Tax=Halomonas sp. SSL-5 TaxID=3065855 RepID=UPI002738778A|nr:diguanylate cyclase [Halomonas sp. SSL-5]MDY7115583.1 diguanylate cyclase [Halomonas sp. SSL-5]